MSQVIKPTNGRIVWFTPDQYFLGAWHDIQQPLAATVCHVWGDRMVNLDVVDSNGEHWAVTSVNLVQPSDPAKQYEARYCEWMPFQKGQAAKTEAAEAKVADRSCLTCFRHSGDSTCAYPNCTCGDGEKPQALPAKPDAPFDPVAQSIMQANPITPYAWSPSCKATRSAGSGMICGFPICNCHPRTTVA
jgi:hypothetical protein